MAKGGGKGGKGGGGGKGKYQERQGIVFSAPVPAFLQALKGSVPSYSLQDKHLGGSGQSQGLEDREDGDDERPQVEFDHRKYTKEQVELLLGSSSANANVNVDDAVEIESPHLLVNNQSEANTANIIDSSAASVGIDKQATSTTSTTTTAKHIPATAAPQKMIAVPGVTKKKNAGSALSKTAASTIKGTKNKKLLSFDMD